MYVNGEWRDSSDQEKRTIINPANGKGIAYAPEGTIEDAKYAIEVARTAFDSGIWSETSTAQRASYLFKIADEIDKNMEELVYLETMDNGKTYREAEGDIGDAAACFRYYAGLITKPDGQTYHVADPMQAMVVREPVGVCGLIVPWNYPLLIVYGKLHLH